MTHEERQQAIRIWVAYCRTGTYAPRHDVMCRRLHPHGNALVTARLWWQVARCWLPRWDWRGL